MRKNNLIAVVTIILICLFVFACVHAVPSFLNENSEMRCDIFQGSGNIVLALKACVVDLASKDALEAIPYNDLLQYCSAIISQTEHVGNMLLIAILGVFSLCLSVIFKFFGTLSNHYFLFIFNRHVFMPHSIHAPPASF